MESEDFIGLPGNRSEINEDNDCGLESGEVDFQSGNLEVEEVEEIGEIVGSSGGTADGDNQLLRSTDYDDETMIDKSPSLKVSFELSQTVAVTERKTCLGSVMHADNGSLAVNDESILVNHKEDGFDIHGQKIGASCILFSHLSILL